MSDKALSMISSALQPPTTTDQFVGVSGSPARDVLWTYSQLLEALSQSPSAAPNPQRVLLTSNITLNVSQSGNDAAGDGSLNKPWKTGQYALTTIGRTIDINGFVLTLQFADAPGNPYPGIILGSLIPWSMSGGGIISLQGNASDATRVQIGGPGLGTGGIITSLPSDTTICITDMTVSCDSNPMIATYAPGCTIGLGRWNGGGGTLRFLPNVNQATPIAAVSGLIGSSLDTITIATGTVQQALYCGQFGTLNFSSGIVIGSGGVTCTNAFANVVGGHIDAHVVGLPTGGAVTGPRFQVAGLGSIETRGGGFNMFPGSAHGKLMTGGMYNP